MTQPIAAWAATTNYPAGAFSYSGTPTKVAPAITYLTPNVPISAQNFNYLLNQRDAIVSQAVLANWAAAAANWNGPAPLVGNDLLAVPIALSGCWDSFYQRWLVSGLSEIANAAGSTLVTCFVTYSPDGRTWFTLNVPTPSTRFYGVALASRPGTGDLSLLRSDGATTSISFWTAGAGTGTDTTQAFLAGVDQGVMSFFNGAFWFVGATGVSTSTWTGHAASSATGSGAWTDQSGGLPGGWASSGAGNTILEWLTAQNASTCVFAMCGATPGTDTSRLMTLNTSGVFADITPAGVLGGTAQEIRGLCYVANDGLWALLTQDNANNGYLYSSPDLSAWTLVQTFTGYWVGGVSAIGSVWEVLVCDQSTPSIGNRLLYSTNVGTAGASSTWAFAAYVEEIGSPGEQLMVAPAALLLSNAASAGVISPTANGAPNVAGTQILRVQLQWDGGSVASSNVAGFSGSAPMTAVLPGANTSFTQITGWPNTVVGEAVLNWQTPVSGPGGTIEIIGQWAGIGSNDSGGAIIIGTGSSDGSYAGEPPTVTILAADIQGGAVFAAEYTQFNAKGATQWCSFSRTVNSAFTVDSGNDSYSQPVSDGTIIVDTSGGTVAVTLPTPSNGRRLRIIDKKNSFATHNCTLVRSGTEKIDNVASTKTLSTNGYRGWVESDGTDWYTG